jgi:hypothetical protein
MCAFWWDSTELVQPAMVTYCVLVCMRGDRDTTPCIHNLSTRGKASASRSGRSTTRLDVNANSGRDQQDPCKMRDNTRTWFYNGTYETGRDGRREGMVLPLRHYPTDRRSGNMAGVGAAHSSFGRTLNDGYIVT